MEQLRDNIASLSNIMSTIQSIDAVDNAIDDKIDQTLEYSQFLHALLSDSQKQFYGISCKWSQRSSKLSDKNPSQEYKEHIDDPTQ